MLGEGFFGARGILIRAGQQQRPKLQKGVGNVLPDAGDRLVSFDVPAGDGFLYPLDVTLQVP